MVTIKELAIDTFWLVVFILLAMVVISIIARCIEIIIKSLSRKR